MDPHVHTEASEDATGTVREVLARAVATNLDAVAITDHDTTVGARAALELAPSFDVVVVPGVEVSTADGHVLGLGVEDRPSVGDPLAATVRWIRDRGGRAVVPHPFQVSRHGVRKRDLTDCDGVEVFNAWAMTGIQNRRAESFAARRGYPTFGASDAHVPSMVGRAYTELEPPDPDSVAAASRHDVLEAIGTAPARAVGRTASTATLLGRMTSSVRRRVTGDTLPFLP